MIPVPIFTSVKFSQNENAEPPIEVILFGIVRLVKPLQALKAENPIVVTLSGIVMFDKFVQFRNAF